MLKKILYPTDFSEASAKAKDELIKMSSCNIEEVIMLHVMDERLYAYSAYIDSFSIDNLNIQGEILKSVKEKMSVWEKELEDAGLKVITKITEGIPFPQILYIAKSFEVSSIIMGYQGHSKVEEMLLGSTAEKVSRKAPVSVILVR